MPEWSSAVVRQNVLGLLGLFERSVADFDYDIHLRFDAGPGMTTWILRDSSEIDEMWMGRFAEALEMPPEYLSEPMLWPPDSDNVRAAIITLLQVPNRKALTERLKEEGIASNHLHMIRDRRRPLPEYVAQKFANVFCLSLSALRLSEPKQSMH